MNHYTQTPVNTVFYVAFFSLLLGLLAFAGAEAINAIFSLSIVALYIAYAIPIYARFAFKNDFKPGPFNLGVFVRASAHSDHIRPLTVPSIRANPLAILPSSGCCSWESCFFSRQRLKQMSQT